ncbi:MAG: sigma-70 family RNA polymerase sigma factor [bacterium]|nr:sigma-70 family RNA polymerase sigma factor [bacterium]
MTNETLVERIRGGYAVSDNMQTLYNNNLPLIKRLIKKYAAYEPMEDLLQESYFGLWEAVQHYESSANVLFMSYAQYWIIQAVQRYLDKCGSCVRIPSHTRAKMTKCRRTIEKLQGEGKEPTARQIAALMGISEKEVQEIQIYAQGVASLDSPISDDDSLTLSDTLQGDLSPENETVDKLYAEHAKNELWGIVERHTGQVENRVIKEIFISNQTMAEVARAEGISLNRIRQIKEKGIRRLRTGKARRELLERFDVVESKLYNGGFTSFREHGTSIVEYLTMQKMEAEERYKRHIREIEERHGQRIHH